MQECKRILSIIFSLNEKEEEQKKFKNQLNSSEDAIKSKLKILKFENFWISTKKIKEIKEFMAKNKLIT